MIRALSILTAVAALAVSSAPVASAGPPKKPPSRAFGNVENIDPFVGMVRPPKPPALHENEGIDGGFRQKPHARRLVSQHRDSKH